MIKGSAGIVETEVYHHPSPLVLESGDALSSVTIAYETYGRLNREKSNAILVCHALSGDAHVAGFHEGDEKPGWWDAVIGPGKALDTDRYFVICSNVIGGCKGSTGPSSINPETGTPYGAGFPVITIRDMVNAQKLLTDHLGISQLYAVAGGSMGGMQALQWTVSYPDHMKKAVVIAATGYSTPQQIAFNEVGRKAIISDPDWNNGDYYGSALPAHGLALARMVGHITYLSNESMHEKFGRALQGKDRIGFDFSTDFKVESYLHHQGDTFTKRFDANSYLYITKAIDYFDLTREGSLATGFAGVKAAFLVISVSSDWLYPPYQSQEIVSALTANELDVHYADIHSNYGHDAFLLESGQLNYIVGKFLSRTVAGDVMVRDVQTIEEGTTIAVTARRMINTGVNHLPVLSTGGQLVGIVTSWDIAKAVASNFLWLDEIMSRDVVTTTPDEPIEDAARKMEEHAISALPVIDGDQHVIGLITADALSMLVGRGNP
ncbi:homoserine O-acetyltransferase [uncultured Methanoregula sp.]|uniref:homoserine O-acetyltransferase MetX n=1 Tax=uncultured Methanoregula sp. TaxID=1005933 RepID=UPI002AAB78A3|nr:homoserine O-acetyltransferase [uncultured Methanoregula sp.]